MRFREVFGQPTNSLQKDDHWTFLSAIPGKAINVLVNGTPAFPAVWLFDPFEISSPVHSAAVCNELEADQIISLIETRVSRARETSDTKAM
jgi:hypothetical protein